MTRLRQDATTAMNAAVNSRARTGRTYGHRRSNERTAERFRGAGTGTAVWSSVGGGIRSEPTVHH
ncbi:hypothetical protein GCM10023237_18410 [Streptomyces coeruleoprunus]